MSMRSISVSLVALLLAWESGTLFGAVGDPALLTAENYAKIENGMTLDQVKAILGHHNSGHGSKGKWTYLWGSKDEGKEKIEIHFTDGKVDRKFTNFAWAKTIKAATPLAQPEKSSAAAESGSASKSPLPGDDKFKELIRQVRFGDSKERHGALRKLSSMSFDPELAPQVSQQFISHLHDKDDQPTRSICEQGLKKWVCPANADHFLREMRRNPKSNSPNDPDRERVNFAIDMLVLLKEPRAVAPLIDMLEGQLFDRSKAQDALIALGPEIGQEEVLKHLNHKNSLARKAVHDILAKYKTDSDALFDRYLADLHSDSVTKRFTAAYAIGRLPVIPERRVAVATELVALLNDNPGNLSDDVKKSTTAKARDRSGNSLTALVDEEAKHPANAAMIALQQWGGAEIEPVMIKHLASKYDDLRYGAVTALGKFGSRRAIPPLRTLQTAEKANIMAEHCKEAIKEIEQREK